MIFQITDKPNLTEMWDKACEKAFKRNVFVEVIIRPERKLRSTGDKSQSHHLNGHIQQICKETGNEFQDVKEYIKSKAVAMGYPMLMKDGKVVVNPYGEPKGISEADSSIEECSLLIEQAHMLASEYGIELREE